MGGDVSRQYVTGTIRVGSLSHNHAKVYYINKKKRPKIVIVLILNLQLGVSTTPLARGNNSLSMRKDRSPGRVPAVCPQSQEVCKTPHVGDR